MKLQLPSLTLRSLLILEFRSWLEFFLIVSIWSSSFPSQFSFSRSTWANEVQLIEANKMIDLKKLSEWHAVYKSYLGCRRTAKRRRRNEKNKIFSRYPRVISLLWRTFMSITKYRFSIGRKVKLYSLAGDALMWLSLLRNRALPLPHHAQSQHDSWPHYLST